VPRALVTRFTLRCTQAHQALVSRAFQRRANACRFVAHAPQDAAPNPQLYWVDAMAAGVAGLANTQSLGRPCWHASCVDLFTAAFACGAAEPAVSVVQWKSPVGINSVLQPRATSALVGRCWQTMSAGFGGEDDTPRRRSVPGDCRPHCCRASRATGLAGVQSEGTPSSNCSSLRVRTLVRGLTVAPAGTLSEPAGLVAPAPRTFAAWLSLTTVSVKDRSCCALTAALAADSPLYELPTPFECGCA